jgi:SAM-dependent methyltransferase
MSLVKEYLESIGFDYDEIKNRFDDNLDVLTVHQRAAGRINPKNAEDIKLLYSDWEYLIKEKLQENIVETVKNSLEDAYNSKLFSDLFKNRDMKILDFGCGNSSLAGHLAIKGYPNVTLADIPTIGFNYVKYSYRHENILVTFLDLKEDSDVLDTYDFIVCSEVMEHITDPVGTLKYLVSHLKTGGVMYLSVFFDNLGGKEPYHLEQNNKYGNPALWLKITNDCGLDLLRVDENNVPKIYVKR